MKDWIPVIVEVLTGAFILWKMYQTHAWEVARTTADSISAVASDVSKIKDTLDDHIKADAENDAKQARRRIIVFSDECRRGLLHSEEHFTSILDDITDYKYYCEHVNPKFKNEKAVHSIKFIEEVYAKAQKENKFI